MKAFENNIASKNNSPSKGFFFQPKLTINKPDDIYEREADSVAEQVMRMPITNNKDTFFKAANISSIQRKCEHCEEEEKLQRKENRSGEIEASNDLENYVGNINSGGTALPDNVRSFFEPRFGYDFSNVRIHNDSVAAKSADSINALAYTSGNNIVFNQNQYSPQSNSGKKLLAHELTHVVQQGNGIAPSLQRMLKCPDHLNKEDAVPSGWKSYHGNSCVFHCCYRGILEDKVPSKSDPMNECFYDETGKLVDENHPYSGCRGTPDYYDSASSPLGHVFLDPGGIVQAGLPAFLESMVHSNKDWGTKKHPFPDGTWYDESGHMHMGPGPKW